MAPLRMPRRINCTYSMRAKNQATRSERNRRPRDQRKNACIRESERAAATVKTALWRRLKLWRSGLLLITSVIFTHFYIREVFFWLFAIDLEDILSIHPGSAWQDFYPLRRISAPSIIWGKSTRQFSKFRLNRPSSIRSTYQGCAEHMWNGCYFPHAFERW